MCPIRWYCFIVWVFVVMGCGRSAVISLTLKLPQGVAKGTSRYDRLVARALHLKYEISTQCGKRVVGIVGPAAWDELSLPEVLFPCGKDDRMQIALEIWDKNMDDQPRSYPAAEGKAAVEPSDLEAASGGVHSVVVPMTFRVAMRDYDF